MRVLLQEEKLNSDERQGHTAPPGMKGCSFGLLSHILPPSPSGQAVVLSRLLRSISADQYCLISCKAYDTERPEDRLPAAYFHLKPSLQLPLPGTGILFSPLIVMNAAWGIYQRAQQLSKLVQERGCSLLLACTGDFIDLPAACIAAIWTERRFVAYIFDDYAYQWTGFLRTLAKWIEPMILRRAATVIVPNEYMQKEYLARYNVKAAVIHNPCSLPDCRQLDAAERCFDEHEINIVYTGAVYHAHYDAFRNLISAIERLGRTDIKLHIFTAQPESELREEGISGPLLGYHPHINESEVPGVLRQADILFLPLAFNSPIPEVIRTSAPGKTGEYLSVGRPILVHAPQDSFLSWYFRTNHCGLVVDRNDPELLSEEIKRLLADQELRKDLGLAARESAERDFNMDSAQEKFRELMEVHGGYAAGNC